MNNGRFVQRIAWAVLALVLLPTLVFGEDLARSGVGCDPASLEWGFNPEVASFVASFGDLVDDLVGIEAPGAAPLRQSADAWIGQLHDSAEFRGQLCRALATRPQVAGILERADLPSERERGSEGGECYRDSTWLTLWGVGTALDELATVLRAVCDARKCVGSIEQQTACWVLCLGPGVLQEASLVLATLRRVDNACTLSEHKELMEVARVEASGLLDLLGTDLERAVDSAEVLAEEKVSVEAVEELGDRLAEAFGEGPGLAGRVAQVAESFRAGRELDRAARRRSLKTLIEDELATPRPTAINFLQLPAEFGGLLEMVREVVSDGILSFEAAEGDAEQARIVFRAADADFNRRDFKVAARRYAESYRELLRAVERQARESSGGRP